MFIPDKLHAYILTTLPKNVITLMYKEKPLNVPCSINWDYK